MKALPLLLLLVVGCELRTDEYNCTGRLSHVDPRARCRVDKLKARIDHLEQRLDMLETMYGQGRPLP